MRVDEAKELILDLMRLDLAVSRLISGVDSTSPDPNDRWRFVLNGGPAISSSQRLARWTNRQVISW